MQLPRQTVAPLVLLGLLTLAACSDEGNGGDGEDVGDTSSPVTAGAMTQAEVEAALLPLGEKVGDFTVRETPLAAELLDGIKLLDEECQPLSSLVRLDVEPAASAWRSAGGPGLESLTVQVQLLSYGGDGAVDVFGRIEQAMGDCADGFAIDPLITHSAALSVEALAAPRVGEAATAYRLVTETTGPDGDRKLKLWSCVVAARARHELLLFKTASLRDEPCTGVPAAVVDAQMQRYADTVG